MKNKDLALTSRPFRVLLIFQTVLGLVYWCLVPSWLEIRWALLATFLSAVGLLVFYTSRFLPLRWMAVLSFPIGVPGFYSATGAVIRAQNVPHQDSLLVAIEKFLFSGIFPEGQISFWLDRHPVLAPGTFLGNSLAGILMVFYFSFYLWGYFFLFALSVHAFREQQKGIWNGPAWNWVQAFSCAWMGAYLVNYLFYILVPATGPQVVFAGLYLNSLQNNLPFGDFLHTFVADLQYNKTDCFPSGHTALSWVTALVALKRFPSYGRFCALAAVLITLATLVLRYHYIVDLLAAVPLVVLGLKWGSLSFGSKNPQKFDPKF